MSARTRLVQWFEVRFPVPAITEAVRKQARKVLPPHVGWFHTFGGMLLFLTVHQITTGILLMVYYRPTPDGAYESVRFLMTKACSAGSSVDCTRGVPR